jgi:regulator of replication initiation timing
VSDSYTMRVAEAVETLRADNARLIAEVADLRADNARLIAEVADLRHDLERSMARNAAVLNAHHKALDETMKQQDVETVAQQRNYGKMNDSLQARQRDTDRAAEDGGMSTGGSENELQFGTELLGAVGWIGSDRSAPRAAPHRMRILQMTRGTRVHLIGKKRTAYVRSARRTPAGLEIQLTKPLGGYVWHMASELEVI